MEKVSLRFVIFFLFISLVLPACLASARVLQPSRVDDQQGVQELKVQDAVNVEDNISNLMGLDENEGCGNKQGEECTERKLVEEAHLDYIYTQRHIRP